MDESTMRADLEKRLAALQRQHADHLALMQAAMAIGRSEGQIIALQQILAGMGSPTTPTDEP